MPVVLLLRAQTLLRKAPEFDDRDSLTSFREPLLPIIPVLARDVNSLSGLPTQRF